VNHLIQELVDQSTNNVRLTLPQKNQVFRPGIYANHKFDLEKYTGLVVKECFQIMQALDIDPEFKLQMGRALIEHFGIKE